MASANGERPVWTRPVILAIALCICAPAAAQTEDIGSVLEQVIEAYGGETNLRKLDNMIQEWAFYAPMRGRHGADIRRVSVPNQLKVELHYPDKSEIRVLSGDRGFVRFDDRGATVASDQQRDGMRLQLMRLYSPLALRERIENLQMRTSADGNFLALTLREAGLRTDYLVNRTNWQIETVVGTMVIKGVEMRFRTEYSDFKIVDGVLIHQRENKFAGEVNTAKLRLQNVELGADFDPHEFEPHGPKDFESRKDSDPAPEPRTDAI